MMPEAIMLHSHCCDNLSPDLYIFTWIRKS